MIGKKYLQEWGEGKEDFLSVCFVLFKFGGSNEPSGLDSLGWLPKAAVGFLPFKDTPAAAP